MPGRVPKTRESRFAWWLIRAVPVFGLPLAGAILVYGSYEVWLQYERMTSCRPVRVHILSTEVVSHYDAHVTTFSPKVSFSYSVGGRKFFSDNCLPADDSGTSWWARGIIARYPVGSYQTGYYRPSNPADAFLVRRYAVFPYFMAMMGVMMTCGMPLALRESAGQRMPRIPIPAGQGWFELRPATPPSATARLTVFCGACMALLCGALCAHYFWVARAEYEWSAFAFVVVYAGLLIAAIVYWSKHPHRVRRFPQARLFIRTRSLRLGQEVLVRAEQPAEAGFDLVEMNVGLLCRCFESVGFAHHVSIKPRTVSDDSTSAEGPALRRSGRFVQTQLTIPPPRGQPTSTKRSYPMYRWFLYVNAVSSAPALATTEFPVRVFAP